jgi:hypothetical protein
MTLWPDSTEKGHELLHVLWAGQREKECRFGLFPHKIMPHDFGQTARKKDMNCFIFFRPDKGLKKAPASCFRKKAAGA